MKKTHLLLLTILALVFSSCAGDDNSPDNVPDQESPSAPLNLIASNTTENLIELSWDAASDNTGVTGYKVFKDGVILNDNVSGTTLSVIELCSNSVFSFYVTAFDAAGNESTASNTLDASTEAETPLTFKTLLSEMGVFESISESLTPASDVQLYEINSTLFTDYATKQRLIRLPNEFCSMNINGDQLLPSFPDNTLIAKTFYYNVDDRDPSLGKIIIETRILLKISGSWQVGNYIWNASQTEASYRETGSEIPVSYIDIDGNNQSLDYLIPSRMDCFTCHNKNASTILIGMKLRNMNFIPSYTNVNQLDFFQDNGILDGAGSSPFIAELPDWTNTLDYTLDERARAYLDINCAHCHQPGGSVPSGFTIDFRYETPFDDTEIYTNRGEIEARFSSTLPIFRMPALGRTIVHEEALTMLVDYIDSLE